MEKTLKITTAKIVNINSGTDTMKVSVERKIRHPRYEKLIKKHTGYLVHAPESIKEKYQVGDVVEITPIAPLSRKKKWKLVYKLEKK